MNHSEEEVKDESFSGPTESYEGRREHMGQAFEDAVTLALESVDEAERDEIKKQLREEKEHLIDLALEERGAEFLNRRVEWLTAFTSRLTANKSTWPDAPEGLGLELKRYLDRYESKIRLEATERAQENHVSIKQALNDTLDKIFLQVQKTAQDVKREIAEHPLSKQERGRLLDALSDRQASLREMQKKPGGRPEGMGSIISAAYEDRVRLEKKLYPESPQNLIEIALVDRATFDPETRENATLFPYLAEKKRQENAAHHAQLVEARTAALSRTREAEQKQEPASDRPLEINRPMTMPRAWWKVWQRNNPRSSSEVGKDSAQR